MNSVSIDKVISKILRDTRVPDSSYITDMYEWIPEAMRLLGTKAPMIPHACKVKINFHVGKLPCGVIDVEAVEYEGKRLGHYNGVAASMGRRPKMVVDPAEPTIFNTQLIQTDAGLDSILVPPTVDHGTAKYDLYMDHIRTTFADGWVTIYYKAMAHDERGLPLVPDHQDYKEAIYWYVRSKLMQSGYNDPAYGYRDEIAWQRFELHASRAIGSIQYPSVDEKEAMLNMSSRFVAPTDYYSSFFNTDREEGYYGY